MISTLNKIQSTTILESNYVGNLSYIYLNKPFIAPITYYFNKPNNEIIGYSSEGHKIKAMRQNSSVCLCVSTIESINSWKSILVHGTFSELAGSEAKAKLHIFSLGVKDLIINKEHRKVDFISEFSSKIYTNDLPIVFVIKIEEISGKMRTSYDNKN